MIMQSDTLLVYPNPVKDKLTLLLNLQEAKSVSYEIFDLKGSKVMQQDAKYYESGLHELDYDVSQLVGGQYILISLINKKRQSTKLIKE